MLAMGYQKYGSVINIFSYLVITLPLGYVLAFVLDYGLYSIFYAGVIGSSFAAIAYIYTVFMTDWKLLAISVSARIEKQMMFLKRQSYESSNKSNSLDMIIT